MKNTTKKITSILLILTIILSCFAFVGCDWVNSSQSTASSTTKATKYDPTDNLVLSYGDNFTNEDIEFVRHLAKEVIGGFSPYAYYGDYYKDRYNSDFSEQIDEMKTENKTFFKAKIDFNKSPYFICAYADKNQAPRPFTFYRGCEVEFFVWYKYESYEDIPTEIDDSEFVGAFAIYDCIIEKDVLEQKEYDRECKFYVPLDNGYYGNDTVKAYRLFENVIIRASSEKLLDTDYLFIKNYLYENEWTPKVNEARKMYPIYVDNEANEYFVLNQSSKKPTDEDFNLEAIVSNLGAYGNSFMPHIEIFDATQELNGMDGSYVCIKLDKLCEICFDK